MDEDEIKVDFMSATVYNRDRASQQFENISSWSIDEQRNLRIFRRELEVAVLSEKYWTQIALLYRLTDGSTISSEGDTGPPTDVGMGVTATAIGGRTA